MKRMLGSWAIALATLTVLVALVGTSADTTAGSPTWVQFVLGQAVSAVPVLLAGLWYRRGPAVVGVARHLLAALTVPLIALAWAFWIAVDRLGEDMPPSLVRATVIGVVVMVAVAEATRRRPIIWAKPTSPSEDAYADTSDTRADRILAGVGLRVPAHTRRRLVLVGALVGVLALAAVVVGAGFLAGDSTPDGDVRATVGQVSLTYPENWVVLSAADRPTGWAWAAQDVTGDAAKAQLVANPEFSALDAEFTLDSLIAPAQVGGFPGFSISERTPATVDGADDTAALRFTYAVGTTEYEGFWLAARADGASRTVAVQLTGIKPLSDTSVRNVIEGLKIK